MLMDFPHTARRTSAAAPQLDRIERKLSRFREGVQPRVREIAARHPWIADLAASFPAVLFSLAYPRRGTLRDRALDLALHGAPLADIARAAELPLWLRTFPPEAFETPLPRLPDSADFRRRIPNRFPASWRAAPRWIDSVALAAEHANEDIAVWMAREYPKAPRRRGRYPPPDRRRLVSVWAWHTTAAGLAGSVNPQMWSEDMNWASAQRAALDWIDALNAHLCLNEAGVDDLWCEPGMMDGYEFVPLRTPAELIEESSAMQNCVRTYATELTGNYARVWSIRKDGARVATMNLGVAFPDAPYPHIVELSAHGNTPAPVEAWLAARRWLHAQDKPDADPKRFKGLASAFDDAKWRQLWKPYWLAKRRIPDWLPLRFGSVYSI